MKIYTKSGDKMQTTTFKGRVYKDDLVIEVEGVLDEVTTTLAFALSTNTNEKIKALLENLIKKMFAYGSELLGYTNGKITEEDVLFLEKTIDEYSEKMASHNEFIIPGKNLRSASIHLARTTVRRLERRIVAYFREEKKDNEILLQFINRLSDLLFTLGKWEDLH